MAKKKVKKIAGIEFIPGIYNYCDCWCERCEQREHCMSFVMGKKLEEKKGFALGWEKLWEEKSIWPKLKELAKSVYEILHELAEEKGIGVEDIYASENIGREFWKRGFEHRFREGKDSPKVESSDIIRMCLIYEYLAEKCLEKIFIFLEDREDKTFDDVLEVVNWYLDLIQVKMRRALYAYYNLQEAIPRKGGDYNGVAKVALLSVDHSVVAWKRLRKGCLNYKREIGHLLVVLEQLRVDIEKEFPYAREFRRPGFEKPARFY